MGRSVGRVMLMGKPLWFLSVITPELCNALASISYQILFFLKELFLVFLEAGNEH